MENQEDNNVTVSQEKKLKIVGVSPISYFTRKKKGLSFSNFTKSLSRFFLAVYEDGQIGVYSMGGKLIKTIAPSEYEMELKKSLSITNKYLELTVKGKKWILAPDPSFTWGAAKSTIISGVLHGDDAGDNITGGIMEFALLVNSMNGQMDGFYNKLKEHRGRKSSGLSLTDFNKAENMPPEIKAIRRKFKNKLNLMIFYGIIILYLGVSILRLYLSGEAAESLALITSFALIALSTFGLYVAIVQRRQL